MPGQFQLLDEKIDQRCVRSSFDCRRAQFDLDRAAVFAHNTVDFGVCNNVNVENWHPTDRITTSELARRILLPCAIMCVHETATFLPDLLCAGIYPPLLAVRALALGARFEFRVVLS